MHLGSHRQSHYHKKWRQGSVLPPRFFLPKRSKNCLSNLAMETGGFSPGGTISLPLIKPGHNTLYVLPVTDQYNSWRIYCLFYTHVWQMLIRTEAFFSTNNLTFTNWSSSVVLLITRKVEKSLFISVLYY